MLAAVDLDDQPGLQAGEINDIGTDRNLTAEAVVLDLLPAQAVPETDFSLGHLSAEPAGTLCIGSRGRVHGAGWNGTPSLDPSPQGGGSLSAARGREF